MNKKYVLPALGAVGLLAALFVMGGQKPVPLLPPPPLLPQLLPAPLRRVSSPKLPLLHGVVALDPEQPAQAVILTLQQLLAAEATIVDQLEKQGDSKYVYYLSDAGKQAQTMKEAIEKHLAATLTPDEAEEIIEGNLLPPAVPREIKDLILRKVNEVGPLQLAAFSASPKYPTPVHAVPEYSEPVIPENTIIGDNDAKFTIDTLVNDVINPAQRIIDLAARAPTDETREWVETDLEELATNFLKAEELYDQLYIKRGKLGYGFIEGDVQTMRGWVKQTVAAIQQWSPTFSNKNYNAIQQMLKSPPQDHLVRYLGDVGKQCSPPKPKRAKLNIIPDAAFDAQMKVVRSAYDVITNSSAPEPQLLTEQFQKMNAALRDIYAMKHLSDLENMPYTVMRARLKTLLTQHAHTWKRTRALTTALEATSKLLAEHRSLLGSSG